MSALNDLMSGDCGGANPLTKLASHSRTGAARKPAGSLDARPARDDQYVNEFLAEQQRRQVIPSSLSMSGLLQEMRQIDELSAHSHAAPQQAPPVASMWAEEFLVTEQPARVNASPRNAQPLVPEPVLMQNRRQFNHPMGQAHWNAFPVQQQQSSRERDDLQQWTNAFAEDSELVETARAFSDSVTDPTLKESKFMQFVQDIADEQLVIRNDEVVSKPRGDTKVADWVNQYRGDGSANTGSTTSQDGGGQSLVEKWAEEMAGNKKTAQAEGTDFWDTLEKQWEDLAREEMHPWLDSDQSEPYKVYRFEEDNPLINHHDPFAEGLKRLAKGDIPSAVLLFEAAVQKNADHAEAWQYLGTSQAENEQEPHAIAALNRCLELQPENLTALLALAVSYTNESMQVHACNALVEWLRQNPRYSSIALPADKEPHSNTSSYMSQALHDRVKNSLLKAIQAARPGEVDPDLQCCLGVLFNLSGDYEHAVDCFKTALQVNPDDSLLWNRLGATLANSSRSEEAVDAYRHALGLSPGFIRSRYNLGIACINLGAHSEAVEHFLQALTMQRKGESVIQGQSVMSDNIWSTLRMTLSLMGRTDLYTACEHRQLDKLNTAFSIQS